MTASPRGIDVHGHGVPPAFLEAIKRTRLGGVSVDTVDGKYVVTLPGQAPLRPMLPGMVDFERRLAWLDEEHLEQQLVGPSLDVPIMLHPPTAGPASCIPGMDRYGGLYGRLIDSTMAAAQLLMSGIFDRFPNLRIVLVHGGGF